jgi:hypothetical protein
MRGRGTLFTPTRSGCQPSLPSSPRASFARPPSLTRPLSGKYTSLLKFSREIRCFIRVKFISIVFVIFFGLSEGWAPIFCYISITNNHLCQTHSILMLRISFISSHRRKREWFCVTSRSKKLSTNTTIPISIGIFFCP